MIFTVLWVFSVEQELARLWLDLPDYRAHITAAANSIDVMLRRDPQNYGESRNHNDRIMFFPPLGVHFEISEEDRTVTVLSVWFLG